MENKAFEKKYLELEADMLTKEINELRHNDIFVEYTPTDMAQYIDLKNRYAKAKDDLIRRLEKSLRKCQNRLNEMEGAPCLRRVK